MLQQNEEEYQENGKRETQEMTKSRRKAKKSNRMMGKEDPKMTTDHYPEEHQTQPGQQILLSLVKTQT